MSNQYIDILKNHGIVMQANFIYPIYKRSLNSELIVEFDGKNSGKVLVSSKILKKGYIYSGWISHVDERVWRDLRDKEYNTYVK